MFKILQKYKPRKIEYHDLIIVNEWQIKMYSITNKDKFDLSIIKPVLKELFKWVNFAENSYLPTYKTGFLIIHQAREGFLILFNWWTGENMLETKIYFSSFNSPNKIAIYPYHPKALICIWELEIFAHERQAWIKHILMNNKNPDFKNYNNDNLNDNCFKNL